MGPRHAVGARAPCAPLPGCATARGPLGYVPVKKAKRRKNVRSRAKGQMIEHIHSAEAKTKYRFIIITVN